MDIASLKFTSKPGKTCNGCLFDESRHETCVKVSEIAVRAGMPDCDDGVIYVQVETDPRQMEIPA